MLNPWRRALMIWSMACGATNLEMLSRERISSRMLMDAYLSIRCVVCVPWLATPQMPSIATTRHYLTISSSSLKAGNNFSKAHKLVALTKAQLCLDEHWSRKRTDCCKSAPISCIQVSAMIPMKLIAVSLNRGEATWLMDVCFWAVRLWTVPTDSKGSLNNVWRFFQWAGRRACAGCSPKLPHMMLRRFEFTLINPAECFRSIHHRDCTKPTFIPWYCVNPDGWRPALQWL